MEPLALSQEPSPRAAEVPSRIRLKLGGPSAAAVQAGLEIGLFHALFLVVVVLAAAVGGAS